MFLGLGLVLDGEMQGLALYLGPYMNTGLKVWRNLLLLDFFAHLSSIQSPENSSQDLNDHMSSSNRCRKDTVHTILVNNRIIRRNFILVGPTKSEI